MNLVGFSVSPFYCTTGSAVLRYWPHASLYLKYGLTANRTPRNCSHACMHHTAHSKHRNQHQKDFKSVVGVAGLRQRQVTALAKTTTAYNYILLIAVSGYTFNFAHHERSLASKCIKLWAKQWCKISLELNLRFLCRLCSVLKTYLLQPLIIIRWNSIAVQSRRIINTDFCKSPFCVHIN